ncbi:hypothetical protein ACFOZY_13150 [Chungangia koreensis]|uniref:Uncharacterized protein n=1 Tax=Chungangia koreensis TaxID=752657 RepID=A0ABV8X8L4_9LACT
MKEVSRDTLELKNSLSSFEKSVIRSIVRRWYRHYSDEIIFNGDYEIGDYASLHFVFEDQELEDDLIIDHFALTISNKVVLFTTDEYGKNQKCFII